MAAKLSISINWVFRNLFGFSIVFSFGRIGLDSFVYFSWNKGISSRFLFEIFLLLNGGLHLLERGKTGGAL